MIIDEDIQAAQAEPLPLLVALLPHGPSRYPSDFLINTNLIVLVWTKAKYCFATLVAGPKSIYLEIGDASFKCAL